ncbi:hypothetical protein [Rhizobium paknamense]|uniref:Uncharacterized protein n=1 Tax=Rhizobium paknamense TaxID=1206817 RepID=A0ABU0IF95_9HYPH|nr:hypothetical protein [Rhizobium paknamense]MDQ0455889.1 hypothetical protein [Rhizobium paknamense]
MVDSISSNRLFGAALALLVLAALVFAAIPMGPRHSQPERRALDTPEAMPGKSAASTFGGRLAEPRADIRAQSGLQHPGDKAWPGFVPRSSGLYTAPGGN